MGLAPTENLIMIELHAVKTGSRFGKRKNVATKKVPDTVSSVEAEILSMYKEGLDVRSYSKQDKTRLGSLRPSQLPFCPIAFFVQHAMNGLSRSLDTKGRF